MAAACLFLAAKVEEQPRKLEHVVKVSNICQNKETPDTKSEVSISYAIHVHVGSLFIYYLKFKPDRKLLHLKMIQYSS